MIMKMRLLFKLIPVLIIVVSCNRARTGDPGQFNGNYIVGDQSAIVFPQYESYEIEFQTSAEPILFFFEKKTADSLYRYNSDDESMYFLMEEGHKKGMFYEVNEPPMVVLKEQ